MGNGREGSEPWVEKPGILLFRVSCAAGSVSFAAPLWRFAKGEWKVEGGEGMAAALDSFVEEVSGVEMAEGAGLFKTACRSFSTKGRQVLLAETESELGAGEVLKAVESMAKAVGATAGPVVAHPGGESSIGAANRTLGASGVWVKTMDFAAAKVREAESKAASKASSSDGMSVGGVPVSIDRSKAPVLLVSVSSVANYALNGMSSMDPLCRGDVCVIPLLEALPGFDWNGGAPQDSKAMAAVAKKAVGRACELAAEGGAGALLPDGDEALEDAWKSCQAAIVDGRLVVAAHFDTNPVPCANSDDELEATMWAFGAAFAPRPGAAGHFDCGGGSAREAVEGFSRLCRFGLPGDDGGGARALLAAYDLGLGTGVAQGRVGVEQRLPSP